MDWLPIPSKFEVINGLESVIKCTLCAWIVGRNMQNNNTNKKQLVAHECFGRCMVAWGIKPGLIPTNDWAVLPPGCQYTLMTHTRYFKAISLSHGHIWISYVWEQTPAVTLWHLLMLLIQSTFIKCFALLASTVITIMQMVKIGRESCAMAAPAHSTQGSQPGRDQSSPSCSCLYSWGTISPNVKLSTKASGS